MVVVVVSTALILKHPITSLRLYAEDSVLGELTKDSAAHAPISSGQAHSYSIRLSSGQFLRVEVEQATADLGLSLVLPSGESGGNFDGTYYGSEHLAMIASSEGVYKISLRLMRSEKEAHYSLKVLDLRESTVEDYRGIQALQEMSLAKKLTSEGIAGSLKAAVEKYEKLLPLLRSLEEKFYLGTALNSSGFIFTQLGDYTRAEQFLEEARLIRKAMGDRYGEGEATHNLGAVFSSRGDKTRAIDYYRTAFSLRQAVQDRRGEASTLANLGSVYYSLGENRQAREFYERAHLLFHSMNDSKGEGVALMSLGAISHVVGENQRALGHYEDALRLFRSGEDRRGAAYVLANLGKVSAQLGDWDRALTYYGSALPLMRAVGDQKGGAGVLQNQANVHLQLRQVAKAIENLELSLAIFRSLPDRFGEANALTNLGTAFLLQGEWKKSFEVYDVALAIRKSTGDHRGEGVTLLNKGNLLLETGKGHEAGLLYENALAISREVGDRPAQTAALHGLARVAKTQGDLLKAVERNEECIRLAESLRSDVLSHNLRSSFLASIHDYYLFQIDVLSSLNRQKPGQGFNALALEFSERARSQSLVESLMEVRANLREGVDPELLEQERQIQERVNVKAEQQARLFGRSHTREESRATRDEIETLLQQYEQVQAQIRSRSPRYGALTQFQPIHVREIQRLLDEETALLEFALGEKRSFLWVVTHNRLLDYQLPGRNQIEGLARRIYDQVSQPPAASEPSRHASSMPAEEASYLRAASDLSKILLKDVDRRAMKKRLLVVSDGLLQFLPLNLLPDPRCDALRDCPLLIEKHELVRVSSAATLALLRGEHRNGLSPRQGVALLADPVFDETDTRVGRKVAVSPAGILPKASMATQRSLRSAAVDVGIPANGTGFPRLAFTRREAEAIASLVPPQRVKKFMDFEASREVVLGPELGHYRWVHFATHGILNAVTPELSGLVLSLVDAEGQPRNGFLRLNEIYNLRLNADLVVLSACRTGLGKEIRGEGLIGLTRGFMYAGAPRVVVSLWQIHDEATSELMKLFYRGMLEERMTPAAALRAAQLGLKKQQAWSHPYYWSAFVLEGDWK
ncbi:MAG: CHAT domain-containing protein [Acidobacteria bacterium]|nr:CHAT domain-containing protein [Acidobacteriota bacterium]MCI0724575.1 CHAT domain-containing protein [Acidobacteriota bacterium]